MKYAFHIMRIMNYDDTSIHTTICVIILAARQALWS